MPKRRAVLFLVASYLGTAAWLTWRFPPETSRVDIGGLILFGILIFVSENLHVPLPRGNGTVSVSFAVIFAAVVLLGPETGAILAALTAINTVELSGRVKWYSLIFNRAETFVTTFLAGQVYAALGGTVASPTFAADLLPALAGGTTFFVMNITAHVCYLSLRDAIPPWGMWLVNFRWAVPNYLAMTPLALFLVLIYNALGAPAVAFFLLPLLVARYSFKMHDQVRRAYLGTISALAAALDARDPLTAGHSVRVGELAALLGRELRLPEPDVEMLKYAGILHDVGKIGIRDAVLLKPGKFTTDEYEEMKLHPVLGGKILADITSLGEAADWIAAHHERWNGSGYPRGLAGEKIPLGARILAVADSCDAMLSQRSYKSNLSWEHTREELKRCSGSQYDPRVVDALLKIADRPEVRELFIGSGNRALSDFPVSAVAAQGTAREAAAKEFAAGDAAAREAAAANDPAGGDA